MRTTVHAVSLADFISRICSGRMLVEQYVGRDIAKKMYPEWRGGYYYAAKPKANAAAPLGLLYVSRWSSDITAAQFAGIYARSLQQRYKKATESIEAEAKEPARLVDNNPPSSLEGRHSWSTEEGQVVIEQKGDTVFVSESLDAATTAAIEREVFAPPTTAQ